LTVSFAISDWNNGKAIGALVDSVTPGLCPDWAEWDTKEALQNATEAMCLADDWLGVRQLIKPDEMTNPNISLESMMTYLSQYPSAKLKEGAPLRPKINPSK
jgi:filamin